jgi:CRP-like cAMP-binding protein
MSADFIDEQRQENPGAGKLPDPPAPRDRIGGNRLLSGLPDVVLARLRPHLEPVRLERKELLFRAYEPLRDVCFPDDAVVSLMSQVESGQTLEVGLVGADGLVGTAVFPGVTTMPCEAIVLIPGLAHRVGADVLKRRLLADEALHAAIGRFAQMLLARTMQMSVCNMFHTVEQRCIRWLLSVDDLMPHDAVPVTHELLASVLGVHRPTVTLVLRSLHRTGVIAERRGRIVIRDRHRLEAACCECYALMCQARQRLLGY